ncbi:MAG TPA: alpha/beta hydrolase [Longimicrobiales bacterium]|nr:alpha/beta hydrolase [Longimicrobiales bacterium]
MSAVGARSSEGAFEGVGRVRLRYRALEVPQPRAALVVVHGLGEHSGRYERFAQAMTASGVSTYAFDQRGHGVSEGRRGHADRFDVLLQDLDRFVREVSGLVDVRLPMFLLGHSMGGLVALRYLEEYDARFRGGIVLAPWLGTSAEIPRWKTTMAGVFTRVLPSIPIRNGIDTNALSRDPEVVRAYREDPLVHDRITPRLFTEASVAMGAVQRRGDRIRTPLLLMVPDADRIVDAQRTLAFARSLPPDDVTIRIYPGHYHELLNEPDHAATIREVRDWLIARL